MTLILTSVRSSSECRPIDRESDICGYDTFHRVTIYSQAELPKTTVTTEDEFLRECIMQTHHCDSIPYVYEHQSMIFINDHEFIYQEEFHVNRPTPLVIGGTELSQRIDQSFSAN